MREAIEANQTLDPVIIECYYFVVGEIYQVFTGCRVW